MAKILVTLPDEMLQQLDERCKTMMMDRSELVRSSIRATLLLNDVFMVPAKMDKKFSENLKDLANEDGAALGLVPDGGTATEQQFLPEFTPGFCTKCYKKAEVKEVTYNDADGNEFKEMLCAKHVKKLEAFIKKEL